MEKLTKKEIRNEIILDLEAAWENPNEKSYWLEKLPMEEDYDEAVHDIIDELEYAIRHNDKEYFECNVNDLIEHYYINQEDYEFQQYERYHMATEAQKKARNKYNRAKTINKTVTLNKVTDADILAYIDGVNFTGLIKELIRKEIKKDLGK